MTVCNLWLLKDSKTCLFFLSDSDGRFELPLNPNGRPYKDDVLVPVFLRCKSAFSWEEIAKILLRQFDKEQVCLSQPINEMLAITFRFYWIIQSFKMRVTCVIIWVFGSTRDHQRFALPYQMKSPIFANAIPIILMKEVKFTHK